jgi:hypothetical protein
MPGGPHKTAHTFFHDAFHSGVIQLIGTGPFSRCEFQFKGAKGVFCNWKRTSSHWLIPFLAFQLHGEHRKEPDDCIVPSGYDTPTLVFEIGSSESLGDLRLDAKQWLETPNFIVRHSCLLSFSNNFSTQVQLVIILSIDNPAPVDPTTPRIKIEHWRSVPASYSQCSPQACARIAQKDWEADWTQNVSQSYSVQLADVFGPAPIPAIFSPATQVNLFAEDLVLWRQSIIDEWRLCTRSMKSDFMH